MSFIKTYMKSMRQLKASEKEKTKGNHKLLRVEMALEIGLMGGTKKT